MLADVLGHHSVRILVSVELGIRDAKQVCAFGVKDALLTKRRKRIDGSLILRQRKICESNGIGVRKPVGHVSRHGVEDPESIGRIVRPAVEPPNIESLKGRKVGAGFKSPKQDLGPGKILLLKKCSYPGKSFCGDAGWFLLSLRAETEHDETQ